MICRICQSSHNALSINLIQCLTDRSITFCGEIHLSPLLIHTEQIHRPVRSVCQAAEFLSVIRKEVDLLPSCLELTGHIESFLGKYHRIDPVEPGLVGLVVYMLLRAVRDIHAVKIEGVLQARHAGDEELLAVRAPERDAEVLVFLRIEVGPDYRFLDPAFGLARNDSRGGFRLTRNDRGDLAFAWNGIRIRKENRQVDDTDADLRVGLAGLRIAGLAEGTSESKVSHLRAAVACSSCSAVGKGRIYREKRYL